MPNSNIIKLNNGKEILLKRASKNTGGSYMYGITPNTLDRYNLSHIILVLDNEGFLKIPADTFREIYLPHLPQKANSHYHVHIRDLQLHCPQNKTWDLECFYTGLNDN